MTERTQTRARRPTATSAVRGVKSALNGEDDNLALTPARDTLS